MVSGVGFLGAGMIFVHKNTISGFTTAAGIWATARIGMAIGVGMYLTGGVATVIVVIVQTILHLNIKWIKAPVIRIINIYDVDESDYQKYIVNEHSEKGVTVHDVSIRKADDNKAEKFIFRTADILCLRYRSTALAQSILQTTV